jgi:hypothetical protein
MFAIRKKSSNLEQLVGEGGARWVPVSGKPSIPESYTQTKKNVKRKLISLMFGYIM